MNDQRSLNDQLKSLIELANENGLYDAADWIESTLIKMEHDNFIRGRNTDLEANSHYWR